MIRMVDLTVRAGTFCLNRISLELPSGSYGVLMGKTGTGKTTLLECLCGLRPIDSGCIELAGEDVTHKRPAERGIGYVPQDGALFPNMTVREQLSFPLAIRNWAGKRIDERTSELAELLGITELLDRYPAKLSGGEIQRVALGRALSFQPRLLLLDEPLSALDDATRSKMYELLKTVQTKTKVTALHVTHSHDEARQLADMQFRLADGKIVTDSDQQKHAPSCSTEESVNS